MKALVSGSSGFVGRHMVSALQHAGWSVRGFDLTAGTDALHYFRGDEGDWDVLIHLAAVVGGRATIEGEPLALAVNLAIDSLMWQWALRTRPRRVVYFSSSAAYPIALQKEASLIVARFGGGQRGLLETDIDLSGIRNPDNLYGWAKLSGEMLAAHAREAGIPVTTLRPFSGYGADQALSYPFPAFIERARSREDPFDVWGNGTQVRDWVHIDDIVATTLACIDGEIDGPLNIGTGRATSFAELARIVTTAAGYDPTIRYHPDAPTGVHYRVADTTLLHEVYKPTITIEEGVDRALKLARRT